MSEIGAVVSEIGASGVAHDGFGPPSAGVYFHFLHHSHFDCNYGDTVMPLDWLFGSFMATPPAGKHVSPEQQIMSAAALVSKKGN